MEASIIENIMYVTIPGGAVGDDDEGVTAARKREEKNHHVPHSYFILYPPLSKPSKGSFKENTAASE